MTDEHRTGIQGAGIVNAVLGAAIFLSPFFTADAGAALWSNTIAGALVVVLAAFSIYTANQHHTERAVGSAAANLVLGLWVLASGFMLSMTAALLTGNIVFGAILAIAAAYNTWAAANARRHVYTA